MLAGGLSNDTPTHRSARSMPRFSIKDLILATTLISLGMGWLYIVFVNVPDVGIAIQVLVLAAGFALFGAGLLAPLKKKLLGAKIGAAFILLVFAFACLSAAASKYGYVSRAGTAQRPAPSTRGK